MNTPFFLTPAFLVLFLLLAPFGPGDGFQGEVPAILISPVDNVETAEDGTTAQLTVVLDFPPTASVTLSVQSANPAEGTASPAELTFTPELWDTPQFITLTGQPDEFDDGDQVYAVQFAVTSDDPGYAALSLPDLAVTNRDDDTAGVQATPAAGLQTSEGGGTDQFAVTLTSRPTAAVTVQAASLSPAEVSVSPAAVTIQPADWAQPAVFTVTGLPDDDADGDAAFAVDLSFVSTDPLYAAQSLPAVTGTNADSDTAGAIVTPTSGLETTENGAADTFTVTLTSRPAAAVTIHAASQTPAEVSVAPASSTILPDDWAQPVTFTVTGLADGIDDGPAGFAIALSAASTDPQYDGIALPAVSGTNLDVDEPVPLAAVNDSYAANEDTPLSVPAPGILGNDTSPGSRAVVLPIASQPAVGNLSVQADGSFLYTPPGDYHGTVSFQYRVTDGVTDSGLATVTITVAAVNDPPAGLPETYLTRLNTFSVTAPGVLANDSDVEDDDLDAILLSTVDPASGTLSFSTSGAFTFTPAAGFNGAAAFTYRAFDGTDYSQPVTVTVTVDRIAPDPVVWTLPVSVEKSYLTTGGMVELTVTAPADAVEVEFYRWDHANGEYVDIAVDAANPYTASLDASALPLGQNQIFARAYDAAGNVSERRRIIVQVIPNLEPQAYLPLVIR